jgi:predicted ATP-dependent endonuclease of OLD family
LKIENFTAFDSLELEFGEGIHAFVGANGTGKTHILKILYALLRNGTRRSYGASDVFETLQEVFQPENGELKRLQRNQKKLSKISVFYDEVEISQSIPEKNGHNFAQNANLVGVQLVFFPAKDILGHAKGLRSLLNQFNAGFDLTYKDIMDWAFLPSLRNPIEKTRSMALDIEKIIGGKVKVDEDQIYLVKGGKNIELNLVAEGWRRLINLKLVIENALFLGKNPILIWDEPESNLNPYMSSLIAKILIRLSTMGVQIFLSTHSYVLIKELDLQKADSVVNYHSLYFKDNKVDYNTSYNYDSIEPNLIEQENIRLYYAELGHILEEDE